MTEFRKTANYEIIPSYINKVRKYFDQLAPQMIRRYKQRQSNTRGCWLTTILPSLIDRQIRMSSNNIQNVNMLESEFISASHFSCKELQDFLNEFNIKDMLPLVIVNSVKNMDNAHLIIVGKDADQTIYSLGDY